MRAQYLGCSGAETVWPHEMLYQSIFPFSIISVIKSKQLLWRIKCIDKDLKTKTKGYYKYYHSQPTYICKSCVSNITSLLGHNNYDHMSR